MKRIERPPTPVRFIRYKQREIWTLIYDARVTRRKFYHFVMNTQGEIVFRSMILFECIMHLHNEGVDSFELINSEFQRKDPVLSARFSRSI